jgi:uncharacterized membrane protein YccC
VSTASRTPSRPKDIEDATALLLLYPQLDLARVRRRVEELAALADEPELAEGLERIAANARSIRRSAARRQSAGTRPRPSKKNARRKSERK